MATATIKAKGGESKASKATGSKAQRAAAALAAAEAIIDEARADGSMAPAAPTLQHVVQASAAPAVAPAAPPATDAELSAILDQLRAEIQAHGSAVLGWFVARGGLVARVVDHFLTRAVNSPTRKQSRATGLDEAESVARRAFDPATEPAPNADLWLKLHWLVKLHAPAAALPSVNAARACVVMISRIDPPTTFGEPERWDVKENFRPHIGPIVARVIAERLGYDEAKAIIDTAAGITLAAAPKAKATDNVSAARRAARKTAESIVAGKIHPETYFDALKTILERYGWLQMPTGAGNVTAGRNGHAGAGGNGRAK